MSLQALILDPFLWKGGTTWWQCKSDNNIYCDGVVLLLTHLASGGMKGPGPGFRMLYAARLTIRSNGSCHIGNPQISNNMTDTTISTGGVTSFIISLIGSPLSMFGGWKAIQKLCCWYLTIHRSCHLYTRYHLSPTIKNSFSLSEDVVRHLLFLRCSFAHSGCGLTLMLYS